LGHTFHAYQSICKIAVCLQANGQNVVVFMSLYTALLLSFLHMLRKIGRKY